MRPELAVVLALLFIALSVGAAHRLDTLRRAGPRPTWSGLLVWIVFRLFARVVHRTRYDGAESLPAADRPLLIVSNHTGAADPILIQAGCPFEVRWMMMREMNRGAVDWFTRYGRIILVERDGRDLASTREALRHLRGGGVIGIFPEGGIERPPETLRRFHSGVGFLVARTGASVVPVWISGTPKVDAAMASLYTRGRARVEFGPVMRFDGVTDAAEITRQIRDRIASMSGWPTSEVNADDSLETPRTGSGETSPARPTMSAHDRRH